MHSILAKPLLIKISRKIDHFLNGLDQRKFVGLISAYKIKNVKEKLAILKGVVLVVWF